MCKIFQSYIEDFLFTAKTASNGRKAITMIGEKGPRLDQKKSEGYDIVFMDLQMPEMDGYEATKAIRENPDFNNLPIIAMTADAMTGVRERVLEAGMNDHVTKPINPEELWNSLIKWVDPGEREFPEDFGKTEEKEEMAISIPSIGELDIENGLARVGRNKKLYRNLISKFVRDYADSTEKIRQNLKKQRPQYCTPILEEIGNYTLPEKYAEEFDELRKHIKRYRFREAQKIFKRLIARFPEKSV